MILALPYLGKQVASFPYSVKTEGSMTLFILKESYLCRIQFLNSEFTYLLTFSKTCPLILKLFNNWLSREQKNKQQNKQT